MPDHYHAAGIPQKWLAVAGTPVAEYGGVEGLYACPCPYWSALFARICPGCGAAKGPKSTACRTCFFRSGGNSAAGQAATAGQAAAKRSVTGSVDSEPHAPLAIAGGRRVLPGKCPRCQGSLYRESDHFGQRIVCLSCGDSTELDHRGKPLPPLEDDDGEPTLRRRPPSHAGGRL